MLLKQFLAWWRRYQEQLALERELRQLAQAFWSGRSWTRHRR